jgi:hypothetical protein
VHTAFAVVFICQPKKDAYMSTDLDSFVSVPLPTALVNALFKRSPHGVSSLIETVVADFLDRTEDEFSIPSKSVGVFWDALFLPNGTQLRTKYFGEFKLAKIDDESIVWDGDVYPSFAQLANAMRGGTMNNAWRELQIKRPSDTTWIPAQSLRR